MLLPNNAVMAPILLQLNERVASDSVAGLDLSFARKTLSLRVVGSIIIVD